LFFWIRIATLCNLANQKKYGIDSISSDENPSDSQPWMNSESSEIQESSAGGTGGIAAGVGAAVAQ